MHYRARLLSAASGAHHTRTAERPKFAPLIVIGTLPDVTADVGVMEVTLPVRRAAQRYSEQPLLRLLLLTQERRS
jgi:hypothetical protein